MRSELVCFPIMQANPENAPESPSRFEMLRLSHLSSPRTLNFHGETDKTNRNEPQPYPVNPSQGREAQALTLNGSAQVVHLKLACSCSSIHELRSHTAPKDVSDPKPDQNKPIGLLPRSNSAINCFCWTKANKPDSTNSLIRVVPGVVDVLGIVHPIANEPSLMAWCIIQGFQAYCVKKTGVKKTQFFG